MTRSPTEMTSSSGRTGVKICRTLRLPAWPIVETVVAADATENRLEDDPKLKNELCPMERKEAVDARFLSGSPEVIPPPMKGAKGRGRVPSAV